MSITNARRSLSVLSACVALSALPGCFGTGGGANPEDIIDQVPTGLMEGAPWTMASAVVTDEGDSLSVVMFPTEVDPCDRFADWETSIRFSVPNALGEYPLRFSLTDLANSRTITFNPGPSQNVIATHGVIVIDDLSSGQINMGLVADADDSEINGRFQTEVCGAE